MSDKVQSCAAFAIAFQYHQIYNLIRQIDKVIENSHTTEVRLSCVLLARNETWQKWMLNCYAILVAAAAFNDWYPFDIQSTSQPPLIYVM